MNLGDRFRINTPQVVHDTIDGETILLNLDRGTYYSLNDSGAALWSAIEKCSTGEGLVTFAESYFEGFEAGQISIIKHFLGELRREGLIVPMEDASAAETTSGKIVTNGRDTSRIRFAPPVIHKYNDMQDLLLLDPIHDVGEMGWPAMKTE
jgi:hypothetical protein